MVQNRFKNLKEVIKRCKLTVKNTVVHASSFHSYLKASFLPKTALNLPEKLSPQTVQPRLNANLQFQEDSLIYIIMAKLIKSENQTIFPYQCNVSKH